MKKVLILLGMLLCTGFVFCETYMITYEFSQKHYSFSITDYLKDRKNVARFQLPTTKEFYDSVKIGDDVLNEFRWGSFVFKGSLGGQCLKIVDKEVIY